MATTTRQPHCADCGCDVDPMATDEGYTLCCGGLVCYGIDRDNNLADTPRWTDGAKVVEACCSAMAEPHFNGPYWQRS